MPVSLWTAVRSGSTSSRMREISLSLLSCTPSTPAPNHRRQVVAAHKLLTGSEVATVVLLRISPITTIRRTSGSPARLARSAAVETVLVEAFILRPAPP